MWRPWFWSAGSSPTSTSPQSFLLFVASITTKQIGRKIEKFSDMPKKNNTNLRRSSQIYDSRSKQKETSKDGSKIKLLITLSIDSSWPELAIDRFKASRSWRSDPSSSFIAALSHCSLSLSHRPKSKKVMFCSFS